MLLALHTRGNLGPTSFPAAENPISQGGLWLNGGTDGIDWNDVQTVNGIAIGHVTAGVVFADPTAILNTLTTDPWYTAQQAQGTVFTQAGTGDYYPEIELRLNTTIQPHHVTGYEFDCGVLSAPKVGCAIIRWNGPLAAGPPNYNSNKGFTVLNPIVPVEFTNGDVMHVVNTGGTGNNLQLYKNGSLVVQCTDHTWTGGSPGLGFNGSDPSRINNYGDEGFRNFSASNISAH